MNTSLLTKRLTLGCVCKLTMGPRHSSIRLFRKAVASGSVVTWRHINLLGEYDFSDEKLPDSVGVKPRN